jgi:sulfate adenylyltransferase subunit 2
MDNSHFATEAERGESPDLMGLDSFEVWDIDKAHAHLQRRGKSQSRRTTERQLVAMRLFPPLLTEEGLRDELGRPLNSLVLRWAVEQARARRDRVLFAEVASLPKGQPCLFANDGRGERFWVPLSRADGAEACRAVTALAQAVGKKVVLFPHGVLVGWLREARLPGVEVAVHAYRPVLPADLALPPLGVSRAELPPHLKALEAESIYIIREAVAEAQNPVMLYSVGKDSGVLVHLARKAFWPGRPPFPLLHVDTGWKFQEMYLFRDFMARASGMELIVHTNPEAVEKGINPFDHGSALYTDITKTEGLKQALDRYRFDLAFGGARRDEEKSRAKERIFSMRTASHRWDPKRQRPELWQLYNTRKHPGESIRVFPLSNWTELDIWHYLYLEQIPVVPLYFARPRPVVVRPEMILMVDDERCRLLPGERIEIRTVRFRTLGCYPLTGAIESQAQTIEEILWELIHARTSERHGRKIDHDSAGSMERKKQGGYF